MAEGALKNAFEMWAAGTFIGLRTFRREPILGLKRIVLPVSYWRTAEFGYARRRLRLRPGARVFDLGSPKDLAVILARYHRYAVTATDILPEAIACSQRFARAQNIDGNGAGRVFSEVQDGRSLKYPEASFDAAVSISVLEHIPKDGDTFAIQELVRVVAPGGVIVITVPFDDAARDTYVNRPVYERDRVAGEPVFFQRHYDQSTLHTRLIEPSSAILSDLEIWGEGRVRAERYLSRLGKLDVLVSPLQPFFSAAFLRRIDSDGGRPMAAFVTLQKR